jgi:hypothetical protein
LHHLFPTPISTETLHIKGSYPKPITSFKKAYYQQLTKFEAAISTLEQDNGGSTMTSSGVNLSSSRAAKQRTRNTGPLGLLGVSLLAADTTGDSGIGTGECGEWPSGGGGRVAVIDLAAGDSEGNSHHSVTPAGLKQSTIEKVFTPANWPFDTMLTRTRARAMKRMTDKSITDSARKLANSVETDVSIVRDMIPGAPASQDVLEVCLTQASLEAKK